MFAPNYHDIPLFKGLGREEINEVLHKFHGLIKHFPKSDYIYLAGDCIENLCVVMEGTVQMIKEDIWGEKSIIANLSAGDVFAENYLGKLSDRSVVSYFAASDSEILMLPLYKEIIGLKLINTYTGVIITGLCNASTIFFFRQFLSGLPKELLDAARIDGASEYRIATKIILPLAKPAFASMGILQAMGVWNAILWPLLVLKGAEKFTLPIGLNTLLTPYGNNYDVLIAGSMFGILPIFVIFLIFQKYIIEGMTAGAVKG